MTSTAPSAAQIETLLNFLEEHTELARGNLRSIEGRVLSHRLWDEITTTLNAMGGGTKNTKQWQKVWTDRKHLAKKAASAARRSASGTGGGPSIAPPLSDWELKVVSIMGDGFGEPQTTATVPVFFEETQATSSVITQSTSSAITQSQQDRSEMIDPLPPAEQHSGDVPMGQISQSNSGDVATGNRTTPTRQRRARRQPIPRADSSVRDRLFRLEEHRVEREERRNETLDVIRSELAGIRVAVENLNRLMRRVIDQLEGVQPSSSP